MFRAHFLFVIVAVDIMSDECAPLVPSDDAEPVPLSAFTRVAPAPRQRRDSAWGVALLASVAFVVASGTFAIRHR